MSETREARDPRFALQRGDALFLALFLGLSALGFLIPSLRTASFAGVVYFGWWMAGLMVLVPLAALLRSLRERRDAP